MAHEPIDQSCVIAIAEVRGPQCMNGFSAALQKRGRRIVERHYFLLMPQPAQGRTGLADAFDGSPTAWIHRWQYLKYSQI